MPELERLVRDQPFRERLIGQLALALHHAGRSADALAHIAAARQRFSSDLGLDLSPGVRELERSILQHDQSVEAPSPRRIHRRRRERRATLAVVGVLALTAAVALTFAVRDGRDRPTAASRTGLLVAVDHGRPVTVPDTPAALASGGGSLWVAEPSQSLVLRIDPAAGSVVDRIPMKGVPGALVTGADSLWVATSQPGGIRRVSLATDVVTQTIRLGINPVALAFAAGKLWAADASDESLIAIDPQTGDAVRTVSLRSHPSSLAVDGTTGWVASHDDGTITEVDLRTGALLATATVGAGPSGLALTRGAVWIANGLAGTVTRLDPASMTASITIPTGSGPAAVLESGGSVWVANEFSHTLTRIDPRTNAAGTRHLAGAPVSLTDQSGRVWVAMQPALVHRGGRLLLLAHGPITSMDPAVEYEVPPSQFHGLAYDALVTFDHTGGAQGLQIVPDLALAVPSPGVGGRSYAFRLRPGIHYSDGRVVRASDVRRAFERLYRVGSPVAAAFLAISGTSDCGRAACDLSRGISVDDARRTVAFHLTRADPEFLFKLAYVFTAPVPPGTPWIELKTNPFPGTGPYRIASADSHRVVLLRNPFFHEWSHSAQPQGNPDQIVWRFGLSAADEARAVAAGRADWMFDNAPAAQLAAITRGGSAALHANVAPETDFAEIDASRPPFDDVRVRRAINLAVDRAHIVQLYGGVARPTCQVLPPGVPGYRPYCPYHLNLGQARCLVRAAGAVGNHVSIAGFTDDPTVPRTVFRYFATVLRRIGLVPHVKWTSHAAFTDADHLQLIPQGWYADYPAASDFFGIYLACNGAYNAGKFCDRKLDKEIQSAAEAEVLEPQRASALWARADRRAVDEGAWVPFANPTIYDLTSARVRGYQHHLLWGLLADQVELD